MNRPQWYAVTALASTVAAASLLAIVGSVDTAPAPLPAVDDVAYQNGVVPGLAPTQAALPLPTLPAPTLPLPTITLSPTPFPTVTLPPITVPPATVAPAKPPPGTPTGTATAGREPAGTTPPATPAAQAGGQGGAAGAGTGDSVGVPLSPAAAAAIIAADPGADLYPQPPVDPVNTPQDRQVAMLDQVQHRIQYLDNVLIRTRADLRSVQRQPDPVPLLLTTLTGGASAPGQTAADLTQQVNGALGQACALSAAIASGESELTRRRDEVATLQQQISSRVQPTAAATVAPTPRGAPPAAPPQAPGHRRGTLLPPVSGRLTSNFGVRFDPYYHVWQLHAGVDLAVPVGTPIVAAADGRVTRAGWYGGYGNYTCVEHYQVDGQRLSTCYGHQSKLLVSVGQQVRAGQVIGLSGSTGASTGPHVHFEVRLGGRPVEPLPWI